MHNINIDCLRAMCREDRIKWTTHVLTRMRERRIKSETIIDAILSGEIIKQYQDDKPFPSCLIFNNDNIAPLHVVVSTDNVSIYVITTYFPTLEDWEKDYRARKETD